MNLDEIYGACLPPSKEVHSHEFNATPSTHRRLSKVNGEWLAQYMLGVPNHPLHELHAGTTAILWLMDNNCEIHFAAEEVYVESDLTLAFVFPHRYLALPEGLVKYGHPTLLPPSERPDVQFKSARCAGDIKYDPSAGLDHPWLITFNSGRYGARYRPHLKMSQLKAVAQKFADNGVQVSPYTGRSE